MGRDLHDGYNRFIEAARMSQGEKSFFSTSAVAELIGCKRGHALLVMRAIPSEKGCVTQDKGRFFFSTPGDFTPEELAGWIETYRSKKKHEEAKPVVDQKVEEIDGLIRIVNTVNKLTDIVETCLRKDAELDRRVAALEEKIRSGRYVEPRIVQKRKFFGLFS